MLTCSLCGGILCFLGKLGKLAWFRCQNCGMDHSEDASELPDEECEY